MNYEKEVLSIPASKSWKIMEEHGLYIYSCPARYSYKKSIFVTFRKQGGAMSKLFKIKEILEFVPTCTTTLDHLRKTKHPHIDEVEKYLKITMKEWKGSWPYEKTRFYILNRDEVITLPIEKRYPLVLQRHTYFKIADFLSDKELKIDG